MDKELVSIFSFIFGWLISQLTLLAKYKWKQRKLKIGLLTELQDVRDILQRSVNIYGRLLQAIAKDGVDPTTALPVPNMFFQQYFKEAFGELSREQRISYQLIHALLDSLNKKNEDLAAFLKQHYEDLKYSDLRTTARLRAEWKERVILLYKLTHEV